MEQVNCQKLLIGLMPTHIRQHKYAAPKNLNEMEWHIMA